MSTTDIVRVIHPSISIYRIVLIIASLLSVFYTINSGVIKKGKYLYFIILLSASPLAFFVSTNKDWAFSFMLNDFMGILMIYLVCCFFTYKDKEKLLKAFVYSQYFTIVLSGYSLFMYYLRGGIPQNIRFLNIFTITLSEGFLRRGTISGSIRLSLPYSTPPHLSIIMVIVIGILLINKKMFSFKIRASLIIIFSSILMLTSSRTGIAAALVVIALSFLVKFNYRINIRKLINYSVSIAAVLLIVLFINNEYISRTFSRFIIEDITQNRHFLVAIEGILIWVSSARNFIIGIGYGSSINLTGRYTFLPPYFLNSFVTLVAEKGVIGLLIVFEFIRLFIKSVSIIKNKYLSGASRAIGYSYLIVFSSFLFYEARQNISVWVIISIVYLLDRDKEFLKMEAMNGN